MGKFDVPAAISYALETTAQSDPKAHDKIFYIGHSMGNLIRHKKKIKRKDTVIS